MPGFWGQYGPKIRDISFLGPLHFAYDHYDYEFRSGSSNRIRPITDDLIVLHYVFDNLADNPHFDTYQMDSTITPIYFLRPSQSILSIEIECTEIHPLTKQTDLGLWLFNRDFSVVWNKRLFPPMLNLTKGVKYEIPMDLESKTLLDAANANHDILADDSQDANHYFYTDLQSDLPPPFISSSKEKPAMPTDGLYLCLCGYRPFMGTGDIVLHFTVTVSATRYTP
jgi:hypothetical protein